MLEAGRTLWLMVKKWKTLRSFTYLGAIVDKEGEGSRGTCCITGTKEVLSKWRNRKENQDTPVQNFSWLSWQRQMTQVVIHDDESGTG